MEGEGKNTKDGFQNLDEVLQFAIGQEEKAAAFYRGFADRATLPGMKQMCREMAREEERHREMLVKLRAGEPSSLAMERVEDLKVSDYLRSFEIQDDLDQQDLMILAMKSEARAEKLYQDLAERCGNPEVKAVLLRLAAEEGKHKHHFEKEYDDTIQSSN